jgi:hypothetical protein
MSLVDMGCSKGLQIGGADAGRDNGPVDCGDPPPESCGYDCQNGRWVRIPLLCTIPDSAIPDAAVSDSAIPDSAIPDVLGQDANGVDARVDDTNDTTPPDGVDTPHDADAPAACANLARTWFLAGSCLGPHATFNGTFTAQMAQTGCQLTFTQTDDSTSTRWTATGALESNGRGYLKGSFGFTDSNMCDLTVTATGWDMTCGSATQQCKLEARTVPDLY